MRTLENSSAPILFTRRSASQTERGKMLSTSGASSKCGEEIDVPSLDFSAADALIANVYRETRHRLANSG